MRGVKRVDFERTECKERKKGVVSPVVLLVFDDYTYDLLFALKFGAPVRVYSRMTPLGRDGLGKRG